MTIIVNEWIYFLKNEEIKGSFKAKKLGVVVKVIQQATGLTEKEIEKL